MDRPGTCEFVNRLVLDVTDVRVERLQEINEEDAAAEWFLSVEEFRELWDKLNAKRGVCKTCKGHGVVPSWSGSLHDGSLTQDADDCPDCKGHDLSFSWGANPWVWVIEFERETK